MYGFFTKQSTSLFGNYIVYVYAVKNQNDGLSDTVVHGSFFFFLTSKYWFLVSACVIFTMNLSDILTRLAKNCNESILELAFLSCWICSNELFQRTGSVWLMCRAAHTLSYSSAPHCFCTCSYQQMPSLMPMVIGTKQLVTCLIEAFRCFIWFYSSRRLNQHF